MFDLWFKDRRRQKIFKQPTPTHWPDILQQSFWYWEFLSAAEQNRLLKLVHIFIREKEIVVPAEIKNAEHAKVTVAAAACLMLLGFKDLYCYDRVKSIVLQMQSFKQKVRSHSPHIVHEIDAAGVYAKGGPLLLAWEQVASECYSPEHTANVVIHEFAHHIDDLDGVLDGEPPFPKPEQRLAWKKLAQDAMDRVEELDSIGIQPAIDTYGLTNPEEFFAEACEAFFCHPNLMIEQFPDLFELLTELFQLDPSRWFRSIHID
jgi:hypothetical protein